MCLYVVFVELLLYACVFVVNIYIYVCCFRCCVIIDRPVHSCMINVL